MDFLGDLKIPTVTSLPSVAQSSGEVVQYNGQLYYCDGSQWHQITPPSGSSGWSLTGNSGTNPSTNFIGTTDNQALAIRVNNQETFRFNVPGTSAPAWSIQRGGGNQRGLYAVDLQSDRSLNTQVASGSYSVISGGTGNTASSSYAVVSGGRNNTASGSGSTVGGGNTNTASTSGATVGGGETNTASGAYGTISGGVSNTASGNYSVVSGGVSNTASGDYSAIPGGYKLNVGTRSFGFSGQSSTTQTNLSANNNIAAFVDVDLWLYNVRNQASKIKLFEPSGSGTNYTSFEAQPQSTNIEYKLPASASPTDTPANKILQSDSNNTLSWLNAQHLQAECEQWEAPKFWNPATSSRVDNIQIVGRTLYPILWDTQTIKVTFPNDIGITSFNDTWHFAYTGIQSNHLFEAKIFLYLQLASHPANNILTKIPRFLHLRWYYSDQNNWATQNFHSIVDIAQETINLTLLNTSSYDSQQLPAQYIVLEGSVRFIANNTRRFWRPYLTYDDEWAPSGNPPEPIICRLLYGYIEIAEIGHMFNEHVANTSNPFSW